MPHLQQIFSQLSQAPSHISTSDLEHLERFVVLMYQRTSTLTHVNEAREELFSQRHKMENIPPTLAALEQHIKRAAYQAGHVWGQTLIGQPEIPSPDCWGWEKGEGDSGWTPLWTSLPEAAKACHGLIKYGCKKSCSNKCTCVKAKLKCTKLCLCSGQCVMD